MLILTRKLSERIIIGDDISITVVRIGPHHVRIGIDAPKDVNIWREELKCEAEVEKEAVPPGTYNDRNEHWDG